MTEDEQSQVEPDNLDEFLGATPKPYWRRHLKLVAGGVAVLLLALLLVRCFGGSGATQYATQTVGKGKLQVTVSATGKLAPTDQVEVGSELSGIVLKVLVDVNDSVTAGQSLAIVDPSRFEDAVRQSEAQVAANSAAVAQAEATLAQDKAQLDRLENVYRLSAGKVPADTELAAGRAEYRRAAAALAAARANVAAAQASLSSNRTSLLKTVIRSPVNGVVLVRQIEPGQTVAASFNTPTLFVIGEDLSKMKLPVAIDEADVGDVEAGQKATFTVDAFPGETFPATITRVDLGSNQTVASASSNTSGASSASQVVSFNANLAVANPQFRLRPGMTATAEIVTKARPDALLVPNAALRFRPADSEASQSSGGGGFAGAIMPRRPRSQNGAGEQGASRGRGARRTVYVLENGKPKPVTIETGVSNGTMTEVIGGDLLPGMKVITGQLANGSS